MNRHMVDVNCAKPLFLLLIFSVVFIFTQGSSHAQTKIMPLGDSITSAQSGDASYRYFLWHQLRNAGYQVDFVGTQKGVSGGPPKHSNFDQDHEGHSGWTADNVLGEIKSWMRLYQPEIVLMLLGANDVFYGESNSSTIEDLRQVINEMRSVKPNVKILFGEVLPSTFNNEQLQDLNRRFRSLVNQMNTQNSPVVLVDLADSFNPNTDTYDGVHPNEDGEKKVSSKWYNSLIQFLKGGGSLPTTPPSYTRGDINGDRLVDIFWYNDADGSNRVWLMSGMTRLSTVVLPRMPGLSWRMVDTGDFNNDGRTDILWRNNQSGQNHVWLMDGVNLSSIQQIKSSRDPSWKIMGTGDFDKDQKLDILWRNTSTGANRVWFMNGSQFVRSQSLISSPTSWKFVCVDDFNNDGFSDIVLSATRTGSNKVWLMAGTNVSQILTLPVESNNTWKIAAAGDYNLDGYNDLLWRNVNTGENRVWILVGGNYVSSASVSAEENTSWKIVAPR